MKGKRLRIRKGKLLKKWKRRGKERKRWLKWNEKKRIKIWV